MEGQRNVLGSNILIQFQYAFPKCMQADLEKTTIKYITTFFVLSYHTLLTSNLSIHTYTQYIHTHTTNTDIHVHILLFCFLRKKTWLIIYYIIDKLWIMLAFSLWPSLLQLETWSESNWFSNFPCLMRLFSQYLQLCWTCFISLPVGDSGQARYSWPILSWFIIWMKDNWIILPYKSNIKSTVLTLNCIKRLKKKLYMQNLLWEIIILL